ncbi:MAG: hypothetical protein AAF654_08470 [Myxococcota bacterium]
MFTLIKGAVSLAMFVAVAYALFFMPVGGQSVASHFYDIWQAPVVQDKVGAIADDVRGRLEAELDRVDKDAAVDLGREWTERGGAEISDEDRKKLEALLRAEAD